MILIIVVVPFQLGLFYDSMITEADAADQIHLHTQTTEAP